MRAFASINLSVSLPLSPPRTLSVSLSLFPSVSFSPCLCFFCLSLSLFIVVIGVLLGCAASICACGMKIPYVNAAAVAAAAVAAAAAAACVACSPFLYPPDGFLFHHKLAPHIGGPNPLALSWRDDSIA